MTREHIVRLSPTAPDLMEIRMTVILGLFVILSIAASFSASLHCPSTVAESQHKIRDDQRSRTDI